MRYVEVSKDIRWGLVSVGTGMMMVIAVAVAVTKGKTAKQQRTKEKKGPELI